MSLRVWLPLNGDLHNQGLSDIVVTNNGATVNTSGKIGSCYSFDKSVSTYLKLTNPIVSNNSGISFAFWIKLPANASGNNQVIHIGNGAGWNNNRCTCFIRSGTSQLVFTCGDGTDNSSTHSTQYNCISSAITLNQWTHVVCSYIAGLMKIYINGIENKNYTTTIAPNVTNIEFIGIGAAPNAGEPCTCYLNDVRIYDHALSDKEVKEIAKGLVLHYKLDNGGLGNLNLLINSLVPIEGTGASGITKSITSDGLQKIVAEPSNGNWVTFANHNTTLDLAQGDTFTFSLMIRSDDSTNLPKVYFQNGMGYFTMQGTMSSNWSIIYYTGTWNINTFTTNLHLGFSAAPGTYYIKYFKLEKGAIYTPWAPATGEFNLDNTIIYDSSGYGNNGIVNGTLNISTSSPRYNISTMFDGVTNCIQVPYNAICPDNIFTINLWFKKDSIGTKNYETLFGGPSGFEMDTRSGSATTLSLYMASTRSGKRNLVTELIFGTWYMITMVRDGTKERYYVNGIYQSEIDAKAMPTGIYRIGAWASNTGQNYYGELSDFRLYNTPLSVDDILELYHTSASIDKNGNIYARELVEL